MMTYMQTVLLATRATQIASTELFLGLIYDLCTMFKICGGRERNWGKAKGKQRVFRG